MNDRRPLLVLGGSLALLLLALAVFGSGTSDTTTTSTTFADLDLPDPEIPTTTLARANEVTPNPVVHSTREPIQIPGLAGRLVVVVGQSPRGHTLVLIDLSDGDQRESPLPWLAADFTIDASGTMLAFDGGTDAGRTWRIVPIDAPLQETALPDASSFVWSGDEPRTGAWLQDGAVVLGTFDGIAVAGSTVIGTAAETDARLVGLTSAGWWTTFTPPSTPRTTLVNYRPRTVGTDWVIPGDLVMPPRTGARPLIARLDAPTWRWTFGLADGGIEPLAWAPGDATGEYGLAALSPTGARVAFIGIDGPGASWVEVHSTEGGGAVDRTLLPFRVWNVGWSPDGLFVVMPGGDDAGRHLVVLLDTATGDLHSIDFDDWVQFTAVVPSAHGSPEGGPTGN